MVIFYSYVSLPEGNHLKIWEGFMAKLDPPVYPEAARWQI